MKSLAIIVFLYLVASCFLLHISINLIAENKIGILESFEIYSIWGLINLIPLFLKLFFIRIFCYVKKNK